MKITIAFHFIEINTCEKPGRGADAEIREMIEADREGSTLETSHQLKVEGQSI